MLDSRLISFLIASTLLLALFVSLLILLVVHLRRKKNGYFVERRRLFIANLDEGERMMKQIGKEVHDNIGQLSHLLYMTLDKIEKTSKREDQVELIGQARKLTDTIIFNADNVSNSLNSDYIKKRGFSNVIQEDLELIRATGSIVCRIEFTGEAQPFYPDQELLIYRIAQEAMHNALKHANASMLEVFLYYSSKIFKMKIKDNGRGFDTENAIKKGIGLVNMQERANLLQGKLEIQSTCGSGCTVSLLISL